MLNFQFQSTNTWVNKIEEALLHEKVCETCIAIKLVEDLSFTQTNHERTVSSQNVLSGNFQTKQESSNIGDKCLTNT